MATSRMVRRSARSLASLFPLMQPAAWPAFFRRQPGPGFRAWREPGAAVALARPLLLAAALLPDNTLAGVARRVPTEEQGA